MGITPVTARLERAGEAYVLHLDEAGTSLQIHLTHAMADGLAQMLTSATRSPR